MPKLLLKFNAAVLKEISFDKPLMSVGRKPDNDIVIDNPAVSGHHCRLSLEGGAYFVEDLASTNGTYVNDKRVQKSGLRHGDMVGIAKHALVFIEDIPAEPAAPEEPATAPVVSAPQGPAAASKPAGQPEGGKMGWLRVLKGAAGKSEYELSAMSSYIGKSDRVQILIQGAGLFGSAPEVAASIHRKAEGYVLVAVTDGYPRLNGVAVSGGVLLKEGDLIECGGTTMQFNLRDAAAG